MYSNTTSILIETNRFYIPWDWRLLSDDPLKHPCHPPRSTLLAHGITIFVSGLLGVIAGHRRFQERLVMLQYLRGRRNQNRSWSYWKWLKDLAPWKKDWTIPFLLHVVACMIVAGLSSKSQLAKGHRADFDFGEYVLFLFQLPRGGHFFLFFFTLKAPKNASSDQHDDDDGGGGEEITLGIDKGPSKSSPWEHAFNAQIIAETLLQLLGMPLMFRVLIFAIGGGKIASESTPKHANVMYSGVLIRVLSVLVGSIITPYRLKALISNGQTRNEKKHTRMWLLIPFLISFTGSWLFYIGFVELAGETYCIPGFVWQTNTLVLMSMMFGCLMVVL